ncbi:MAG: oxidoreductase [Hyphomicrobiales bacterium]|nr:MAG: oxidoreductase [Hyphomicrobiales bacterium]
MGGRKNPSSIVITGATGGIGNALARHYAAPGVSLCLTGRDRQRLEQIAEDCRQAGAEVVAAAVDVRDRDALYDALRGFDERTPVDLLIANAGVSAGLRAGGQRETDEEAERLADINYKGTINTVHALIDQMRARKSGHIAMVSSLAGMRALPEMPSYSATKAAIIAYGDSLRGWLKTDRIDITVICPGFVTSPMSARHIGPKPLEISAEKAAGIISRGLARRRSRIAFPWPLVFGIWLSKFLPPKIADLFMNGFAAEIEPDPRDWSK